MKMHMSNWLIGTKIKLTNFVFYFLKDEEHSEDIVQETFIKLYEKKHYYKEIAKFSHGFILLLGTLRIQN